MSDRFTAMQLFVRVARTRSFSVAAREMGMTQPSASRIIAMLEKQVGVPLLWRSTRMVALTDAGANYVVHCERILGELEEADLAARGMVELRGTLRIATSPSFARRTLMPRLAHFTDRHPKLRVECLVDDAYHRLADDTADAPGAVDVAVRIGVPGEGDIVARRIGSIERILVASPGYLARAGTPLEPAALAEHSLIVSSRSHAGDAWAFRRDGDSVTVRVRARFVIDSGDVAVAAAIAGLGIVSTDRRGVRAELESGALVPVLPQWTMGEAEIHVILPLGRSVKASARAFAEFVEQETGAWAAGG